MLGLPDTVPWTTDMPHMLDSTVALVISEESGEKGLPKHLAWCQGVSGAMPVKNDAMSLEMMLRESSPLRPLYKIQIVHQNS